MALASPTWTATPVPVKRPTVSFNVESDMTQDNNEPLPIVELKPFVHKVWRREKSLPSFYDRSDGSVMSFQSTTGSRNKECESPSEQSRDESPPPPPPRSSQSLPTVLPTQRYLQYYVNTFDDFKSQKEHIHVLISESGYRPKSRIHPLADSKTKKQPEHVGSVIPGFITREDRTKTTLTEISEGGSNSRVYSCSSKALNQQELRKQQQIRLTGEPLSHNDTKVQPRQPSPMKNFNAALYGTGVMRGSPASVLYHDKTPPARKQKRAKTPLYDHLDRKGTLPSLTVHAHSLKKRPPGHLGDRCSETDSEDYSDYRDSFDQGAHHKVGGIENSLKVLSQHGTPTKVERQLSFEFEISLSRIRKSKDYSPFEVSPAELAKYLPQPAFNMTQGECNIQKGLQSNASRRRGNAHRARIAKPNMHAKGIPGMDRIHPRYFQGIEHIDSFGQDMLGCNGYQKHVSSNGYDRDRATSITTDDDLIVPNDTPRSQMESRISVKPSEDPIMETNEGYETDMNGNTLKNNKIDNHTQTVNGKQSRSEDVMRDGSPNKSIKSETPVNTNSRSESVSTLIASGKTFITADTVPSISAKG